MKERLPEVGEIRGDKMPTCSVRLFDASDDIENIRFKSIFSFRMA